MAMSFFQKAWNAIKGEANEVLDNAIDPVVMMKQGIRELDTKIGEFESALTGVIAQRNLVQLQLREQQEEAVEWRELAKSAKQQGKDNEALEAAERSIVAEDEVKKLENSVQNIIQNIESLKDNLKNLKNKKSQAELEVRSLEARSKAADASIVVNSTISGVGGEPISEMLEMSRKKVSEKEARSAALTEVGSTDSDLKSRINSSGTNKDKAKSLLENL